MKEPRKGFELWLSPQARQKDGTLWLPESPTPKPRKRARSFSSSPRRGAPADDPFTAEERKLLRKRLPALERSISGLATGLQTRGLASRSGKLREWALPPVLCGLVDRGLLRIASGPRGIRCVFTDAGVAAMRAFFLRQPADFTVLFPHLHRDLGLGHLLDPP